jgi:hypothetical protein
MRDSGASPPELRPERSSSSNEACKEMEEMLQEEALNEDLPPPKPAASGSLSTPTKQRIPKKKKMKEKKTRRGNSQQLRKANAVQQPELQSSSPASQHLDPSQRPREAIPDVEGPQARAPARDLRVVLQSVREKVGAPQADDPTPDGPPAPAAPGPRREEDHFRVEIWCEPQPIPPSVKSEMFITAVNLLVLDLEGSLTDIVAREWLPGNQGKVLHLFIASDCPALFSALVNSEEDLKPKLHPWATHAGLHFACRNVEAVQVDWARKQKQLRFEAALKEREAWERSRYQWEIWIPYNHLRAHALTTPMAKRALLCYFEAIDEFDFVQIRLGEGLQSVDMPSATIKAVVWGLKKQQLPWFLRDPHFPELPIYYKHNQRTKWALCPICHHVCVPCADYCPEPGVPSHKWKNQKYHLCPLWQQLNPQQPKPQRLNKMLTVTELMESMGAAKKLKSGAEAKTGQPRYRSL